MLVPIEQNRQIRRFYVKMGAQYKLLANAETNETLVQ